MHRSVNKCNGKKSWCVCARKSSSIAPCANTAFHHFTTSKVQWIPSLFLVSTPTAVLHDGGLAWSSRPPVQRVSQPVAGWGRCLGGVDSYPGFLGSLSRDEPPPFSLRTSFSLLRRIEARSLLKDPLLFREPEPSWWDTSQSHSYTPLSNIFRRVQTQNVD